MHKLNRIEKTAKTLDEAVNNALKELNAEKDMVEIEIVEEGNRGLFGFIGNKMAKVRVSLKEEFKEQSDRAFSKDSSTVYEDEDNSYSDEEVNEYPEHSNNKDGDVQYGYDEEAVDAAETFVREVLNKMDVEANVETTVERGGIFIRISGDNVGILIGRRGETLDALQYLTGLVVNKKTESRQKVVIDIESYRSRREDTLVQLAKRLEKKVLKTRKSVTLEPMTPYERRIIHSTLQESRRVDTYSVGDEPYRKIVIKPK